jgi:ketosteroid isomerase-like protein
MSQENVEVVRSMYASFGELAQGGDVASYVAAHYDRDCEYRPVEETGAIRGHDALIRWTERWLEAWEEYVDEIEEIVDADEVIVGVVKVHARGRDSGMEISQRLFHVCEVRNGKVQRLREYLDRNRALEAAGLRE